MVAPHTHTHSISPNDHILFRLQSAFILNLQNHWLPIRRFSSPNRWYNLNSFLDAPQWISPTFLAMVLSQAEEEGYNVFVVRPLDPTALGDGENGTTSALPESQADLVALELGEPDGRSAGGLSNISTGECGSMGRTCHLRLKSVEFRRSSSQQLDLRVSCRQLLDRHRQPAESRAVTHYTSVTR
jgi:hypothetical protein